MNSAPAAQTDPGLALVVRDLGRAEYLATWEAMRAFTDSRGAARMDEIWLVEHPPVYTLGTNSSEQPLANPDAIPVVKTDRGGQITYHGPGPIVAYTLIDLRRRGWGVKRVSIWHGSAPNPWMRGLLENFSMIDGTWIEIRKEGKLAGCGAVVRDNHFQLATGLGLEDDVPGGYFLLLYTALQEAFEHNIRLVRFGTGAYDVKRRLGFHLEDTNHAMISMAGVSTRGRSKRKTKPD